jgi:Mg-chelatase subunit ChlI
MNYARQHRLDRRARQNIDNLFRIDTLKMCKREKHDKVCSVVAWMYRIKLVNRHKKRVEGIGGGVEIESEAEREQREKEEKEDLERNAEMWRKADEEKKKKEKEEEERKEKEEEERERKEEEEEEEKERKEKEEKEKEKAKDKTYKRWAEQEMFSAPGLDVVAKGWIG